MSNGVFLVFRPVLDYEDSLTPFLVCDTQGEATAVCDQVIAYANRLINRLPQYPSESACDDQWMAVHEKRQAILARARWPLGINLESDISRRERGDSASGLLETMFLPRVARRLSTAKEARSDG